MIAAFAQIKLKLDTRPRPELLENSNIAFTHIKVEFTFASPLLLPVTVTFNLFFIYIFFHIGKVSVHPAFLYFCV